MAKNMFESWRKVLEVYLLWNIVELRVRTYTPPKFNIAPEKLPSQ